MIDNKPLHSALYRLNILVIINCGIKIVNCI